METNKSDISPLKLRPTSKNRNNYRNSPFRFATMKLEQIDLIMPEWHCDCLSGSEEAQDCIEVYNAIEFLLENRVL